MPHCESRDSNFERIYLGDYLSGLWREHDQILGLDLLQVVVGRLTRTRLIGHLRQYLDSGLKREDRSRNGIKLSKQNFKYFDTSF